MLALNLQGDWLVLQDSGGIYDITDVSCLTIGHSKQI